MKRDPYGIRIDEIFAPRSRERDGIRPIGGLAPRQFVMLSRSGGEANTARVR